MMPTNKSSNYSPTIYQAKLRYEPPFDEWLFSTCRAIMDSKYNEYILYEDMGFSNVSRLTEFAYSWLGKFCVDQYKRKMRLL